MSKVVVSDRFNRRSADLMRYEAMTPEGVPLVFSVARAGDRAGAFVYDLAILAAMILATWLIAILFSQFGGGGNWTAALVLLAFFLLRNGYFVFCELRMQGRTPGKKRLGLRVIDASGGMLTADAIFVRNLTREVEVFIPLIMLANPQMVTSSGPGWVRALSALWVAVFLLMPMLNKQRRRVGDLLAGTLVVLEPKGALSRELASVRATQETQFAFTAEQLAMYGIYELQVLEEMLRDEARHSKSIHLVATKIQRKIGWADEIPRAQARDFLEAFYRAQRGRLEKDLLLGKAREHKREGQLDREDADDGPSSE